MLYMNEYNLIAAKRRFAHHSAPNRLALAIMVDNLREATDEVSDGWAYWPKPVRAAQAAMKQIESTTYEADLKQEAGDITNAEMRAAARPIRGFLTRHSGIYGPERIEHILRSIDAPTEPTGF